MVSNKCSTDNIIIIIIIVNVSLNVFEKSHPIQSNFGSETLEKISLEPKILGRVKGV